MTVTLMKKTPAGNASAKSATKRTFGSSTPAKSSVSKAPSTRKSAEKAALPGHTQSSTSGSKQKTQTTITAKINLGWGNNLYLRGEGGGLSWEKGTLMKNISSEEWAWSANTNPQEVLTFKFLINDTLWAFGENITLQPGKKSATFSPTF